MAQVNAGRVRFVSRGSYDNSTQYYTFDFVSYNGNCYYAKESTLGNLPTDTNKWQLVATKGNTGDIGPTGNGISSITKTSTSGLVDTYTILYTNGSTTTYDVTNGQDGNITDVQLDGTSIVNNGVANALTTGYSTDNKLITEKDYQRAMSIYNVLPKVNGTGENISLDNTGVAPLNMELKGNTSQISYTGKNLASTTSLPITQYGITISKNENGDIVINGTPNYSEGYQSFSIGEYSTSETGDYTLSVANKKSGLGMNIGDGSLNITMSDSVTSKTHNFSTPFTINPVINIRYDAGTFSNYIFNPQLEKSATQTDYEPYVGGTPSPNPSYPQLIQVVSGDNEISVCGKNLFDKDNANIYNGYIASTTNHELVSSNNSRTIYIPCLPNTTYCISKTSSTYFRTGYTYELPTTNVYVYGYNADIVSSKSITTDGNAKYLVCTYWANSDTLTEEAIRNTIQIERGNTATSYEPYTGTTYPINLGDIELCKIGTYQDKFFKAINGNTIYDNLDSTIKNTLDYGAWYLEKNIKKVIYNGNEQGWTFSLNIAFAKVVDDYLKVQENICFSNYFKSAVNGTIGSVQNNEIKFRYYNDATNNIYIRNNDCANVNEFKTWLSTHNTIVYYVLATPTYTKIEGTLANQLENIKYALSKKTQTNITSVANDLPFIINAETLRDISNLQST